MVVQDARTLVVVALSATLAYWLGWLFGHAFGSRGWSGPAAAWREKAAIYRVGWAAGFWTGRRSGRRLLLARQHRRSAEGIRRAT